MLDSLRSDRILEAIRTAGVLFTCFGVFAALHAWQDSQEWNRRKTASDILQGWNYTMSPLRSTIGEYIASLPANSPERGEFTLEQCKKIYSDSKLFKVREAVVSMLNYFEFIAADYENGVIDKSMIDTELKPTLLDYREALQNWITYMKQEHGTKWTEYEALAAEWRDPSKRPRGDLGVLTLNRVFGVLALMLVAVVFLFLWTNRDSRKRT